MPKCKGYGTKKSPTKTSKTKKMAPKKGKKKGY